MTAGAAWGMALQLIKNSGTALPPSLLSTNPQCQAASLPYSTTQLSKSHALQRAAMDLQ